METNPIEEPLDLIKFNIDEKVKIKMRNNRTVFGVVHAFDQHLNMILGEVEEFQQTVELDDDTSEEVIKVKKRLIPMLFLRGDGIITISPKKTNV